MQNSYRYYLFLILASAVLYIPFLGGVHLFDWDEINFAESAREMIVSGNYLSVQIDFKTFWEKPPLFIWIQVLSMKIFGINEFAARFPNAICGITTMLIIFRTGQKLLNERFGLIWSLLHAISFLPFIYFKSGIIDPWFNLFIFLGISNFIIFYKRNPGDPGWKLLLSSALFTGLSVLTKGPVGLLIFGLVAAVYIALQRFRFKMNFTQFFSWIIVFGIIGGFWFLLLLFNGDSQIIAEFFDYQIRLLKTEDAGHGGFLFYHFVILLFGVFPSSVMALSSIFSRKEEDLNINYFKTWMNVLFWVVLILFTIVKTKIVHYSSMAYFPITFFAAITVYKMLENKIKVSRTVIVLLISVAFLWAAGLFIFPFIEHYKYDIINSGLIKDMFATGNLMAEVKWTYFEPFIAVFFLVTVIWAGMNFNRRPKNSITALGIASTVFILFFIYTVTPRIEAYSQKAAIEFFKSKKNDNVYVQNLGYKSYAPLFYSNKSIQSSAIPTDSLLYGKIQKDAYFIFKNSYKNEFLKRHPDIEIISEKNGFVFAKREMNTKF